MNARTLLDPLRPVWWSAFRGPVTEGHVRLHGLSWTERQAARVGLVTLVLLLGSLLLADRWRRGDLLPIGDGENLTFLPAGLVAATLLCFVVAWTMLLWGALTAAWPVRVAMAVVFLLTNASLAIPASLEIGDHRALRWGNELVSSGYYTATGLLVLSIGLRWLPVRVAAVLLPVLRVLVAAAVAVFFMTHLWVHLAFSEEGFSAIVQQQVANSVSEIDGLLQPLVYVAAILVIDFGLNTSLGVAESVRTAPVRVVRWVLVALLAVKLWFLLLDELGEWATYVHDRPAAVVRTLVSVALLAALVLWVARLPLSDAVDEAKERALYLTTFAFGLPVVTSILVVGTGVFVLAQFHTEEVPGFVDAYPTNTVSDWGLPLLAALAVVVGVLLVRRRRTPLDLELGSALVCIGAWALPSLLVNHTDWELGFSDKLLDLTVTLGIAVVVAVTWRRLTMRLAIVLAALTVFTWLAMTRGDWVGLVGSWFALPAVLVTVFGILLSVASDAGFTAEHGRVVPQGSRVLLFVGYVVLSVTLLHWVETTHASDLRGVLSNAGFFFIGIPWAAWTVGRKVVHLT